MLLFLLLFFAISQVAIVEVIDKASAVRCYQEKLAGRQAPFAFLPSQTGNESVICTLPSENATRPHRSNRTSLREPSYDKVLFSEPDLPLKEGPVMKTSQLSAMPNPGKLYHDDRQSRVVVLSGVLIGKKRKRERRMRILITISSQQ
jgi:hypothetical protein